MKTSRLTLLALAGLLTAFVTTDVVEAGKTRSTVERRLRPGRGYWQSSPQPTARSYRSPVVQPQQLQSRQQQPRQVQGPTSPYRPVYAQPRRFGWRLFQFR